ncbi:MAG: nucleotidyltransferase domain-containing protein [Planctomycetota bacterium]|jgi:hypothetical protein|nr:nucleotidyltransferase domain-containing protein [Planctomycetota bacterium]MDP6502876.1 nucleotidyltransferase domain-containing protein [Planctomycetota bacterium]
MNTDFRQLEPIVEAQPHPLIFVTIGGAHLYGFPSRDSDYDLRGAHVLPVEMMLGLKLIKETIEISKMTDGIELDLVTHDVKKLFLLLLKKNGYVLEQVMSPLIVHTSDLHDELKAIAANCITCHHVHHYLGFSNTQWKLFEKENPPRVKPLLYVYRVLLTGIHLMRTGEVEADLSVLNETFKLSYIGDLIQIKMEGNEKENLEAADLDFHQREIERLQVELKGAGETSHLPEYPTGKDALNDLLVRIRLGGQ